jgi:hypothetical protein
MMSVLKIWNGAAWVEIPGGVADHGLLGGLGDDDHDIYVREDGSRGFSSTVSGVDPVDSDDLATKNYVDTEITVPSGAIVFGAANQSLDNDNPNFQFDKHKGLFSIGDVVTDFTFGGLTNIPLVVGIDVPTLSFSTAMAIQGFTWNDLSAPTIAFRRARGSTSSPVAVAENDTLGTFAFGGWAGTTIYGDDTMLGCVTLSVRVDDVSTMASGVLPGRLVYTFPRYYEEEGYTAMEERTILRHRGLTVSGTVDAVSGTYSESLTVSGTPVNLVSPEDKVDRAGDVMTGNLSIQNDADLWVEGDATVSGEMSVGSGTGGDAVMNWQINKTLMYVMGVDDSDYDKFKIASSAGFDSGNLIVCDGLNRVTISGSGGLHADTGFYPRRMYQSACPTSGTGSNQIDDHELAVWTDSDNDNIYLIFNDPMYGVARAGMGTCAWETPTLSGDWSDYGGSFQTARYRVDTQAVVTIEGFVAKSSGLVASDVIFSLPDNYKPALAHVFSATAQLSTGFEHVELRVLTTGEVIVYQPVSGTSVTYLSLEAISFAL